jgi:hypothetical protein
MRSVVLVMSVDVEVAGPGPCIKPRDGFLDLKKKLSYKCASYRRSRRRERSLDYISGDALLSLVTRTLMPFYFIYFILFLFFYRPSMINYMI